MKHWQIDEVAWSTFDPARVDPAIVPLVKAAAMVERNGTDYAVYLNNVFHQDPDFRQAADNWAVEEVQHGDALGKWSMLADPSLGLRGSLRALQGRLPGAARRGHLRPRLAHRRADRALHGGDRHELLLHGAGRGDRGAGAARRSAA